MGRPIRLAALAEANCGVVDVRHEHRAAHDARGRLPRVRGAARHLGLSTGQEGRRSGMRFARHTPWLASRAFHPPHLSLVARAPEGAGGLKLIRPKLGSVGSGVSEQRTIGTVLGVEGVDLIHKIAVRALRWGATSGRLSHSATEDLESLPRSLPYPTSSGKAAIPRCCRRRQW